MDPDDTKGITAPLGGDFVAAASRLHQLHLFEPGQEMSSAVSRDIQGARKTLLGAGDFSVFAVIGMLQAVFNSDSLGGPERPEPGPKNSLVEDVV